MGQKVARMIVVSGAVALLDAHWVVAYIERGGQLRRPYDDLCIMPDTLPS